MNSNKLIRVLLLCGGQSTEHEISLESCYSVAQACDRSRYEIHIVGISRDGVWYYYGDREDFLVNPEDPAKVRLADGGKICFPGKNSAGAVLEILESTDKLLPFDLAFPVLHGAYGEDGTIQGLFQMLGVPCVGCDLTSSANCMDKALTKIILNDAGFQTARGITLRRGEECPADFVGATLSWPVFVKPAKTGSSIGIRKVSQAEELAPALEEAFRYDDKVLIEEAIVGREIECGVLEKANGELFVAHPGEVVPHAEFYSYEAKYLDPQGATVNSTAFLEEEDAEAVRKLAAKAFRALGCSGMSRIDFFFTPERRWVLNEVNTIPGFTKISLYPQMMAKSGIAYSELIDILIDSTLAKFQRLQRNFTGGY